MAGRESEQNGDELCSVVSLETLQEGIRRELSVQLVSFSIDQEDACFSFKRTIVRLYVLFAASARPRNTRLGGTTSPSTSP
jgi:hypothetical protein